MKQVACYFYQPIIVHVPFWGFRMDRIFQTSNKILVQSKKIDENRFFMSHVVALQVAYKVL